MRSKLFLLFNLIVLTIILTSCSESVTGDNQEKESYDWNMTVTVGPGSTWYEGAEKFAQDVAEETDGRIEISVYSNEQLSSGDPEAGVEQLMDGTKDLSYNSTIIYAGIDPRFGVLSAPFLINDYEEAEQVINGEGGELIEEMARERGVEPLGFAESGFRQITNDTRPIQSPQDLEDLKIRIPAMGLFTDLYRNQGSDPLTMDFSEVYTALQQGTIDGQENPVDVTYSSGLNEVQDYMTLWNYVYDALILGMNKELYDSLHPEDQEMISRLAAEANQYQVETNRELEEEQIKELEEAGMEVYTPSDDELEEFRRSSEPIYKEYEDIWGSEHLDIFRHEAED